MVRFKITCVLYDDVLKKNSINCCDGSNSVITEGTVTDIEHAQLIASSILNADFKKDATISHRSNEDGLVYEEYINKALLTFFLLVYKAD